MAGSHDSLPCGAINGNRVGLEANEVFFRRNGLCNSNYRLSTNSMDSRISSGTGTPVPNGITEKEAGNLIYYIMRSKKIVCFEMVEINPTLDKENLMAENAFEILQKATNQLNNDF